MYKKTISYQDYDGNERKEVFMFNITKTEFTKMDLSTVGGFEQMMRTIIDKKDIPAMLNVFDRLITMSYGVKSPDGKRFMKNEELTKEFVESPAYDELFMELAQDSDAALAFIRGIMPVDEETANKALATLPSVTEE